MNSGVAFVAGAAVGAVVALFLAPKSGQDLRAELAEEARDDRARLQKEYARAIDDVHKRLDKVHADVQSTMEHAKQRADEAAENL